MKSPVFCLRKEVTRSCINAFLIQLRILLSKHDSCAGLRGFEEDQKRSRHRTSDTYCFILSGVLFIFAFVLVLSLDSGPFIVPAPKLMGSVPLGATAPCSLAQTYRLSTLSNVAP